MPGTAQRARRKGFPLGVPFPLSPEAQVFPWYLQTLSKEYLMPSHQNRRMRFGILAFPAPFNVCDNREVQGRKFWCSYLLLLLSQIKLTAIPCYRKYKSHRYESWLISVFQGFCTHGCFHSCRSSYRRTLRCAQHLQFSKAGKNFIFVKTKWGVAHFLAKGLFYSKTLLSADLHL